METSARPPESSLSDSKALAIFSGCISKGVSASAPSRSFFVAWATGTSAMKGSQWAK